jgi:hypothetical protein
MNSQKTLNGQSQDLDNERRSGADAPEPVEIPSEEEMKKMLENGGGA